MNKHDDTDIYVRLARMEEQISNSSIRIDKHEKSFSSFKDEIRSSYTTLTEFKPVRSIIYGLVGIVTIAVLWTVLNVIGLRG